MSLVLYSNLVTMYTGITNLTGVGNFVIESILVSIPIGYSPAAGISQYFFAIQTSTPNYILINYMINCTAPAATYYQMPAPNQFKWECPSGVVLERNVSLQMNIISPSNWLSASVACSVNIYGYSVP